MRAAAETFERFGYGTATIGDIIAQAGVKRDRGLPDVPLLTELANTEVDREIMALISSTAGLGQPYLAPPGIPADRLAVLRHAVDEGFIRPQHAGLLREVADIPAVLAALTESQGVDAAGSFT